MERRTSSVQWKSVGPLHTCAPVPGPCEEWSIPEVPFGAEIRASRLAAGVSGTAAAAACGLDQGAACNVEKGERIPPQPAVCSAWVRAARPANPEVLDALAEVQRKESLSWAARGPLFTFWGLRPRLAEAFAARLSRPGGDDAAEAYLAGAATGWESCVAIARNMGPDKRKRERLPRKGVAPSAQSLRPVREFFRRRPRLSAACRRVLEAGWAHELEASVRLFAKAF